MTAALRHLDELHDLEPTREQFRAAILLGLAQSPKRLPSQFFYDARGSALFDEICEQPEYYPTRTECGVLEQHAAAIAALIGPHARLIEYGSGAGRKIRLLLAALVEPAAYVPIDISRRHLLAAAADLAVDYPGLRIAPVCADYTHPYSLPSATLVGARATAAFFPGSTIGNFTPEQAWGFLAQARRQLGRGAVMIVGVDRTKDPALLDAAYNDAAGVTARFNLNLLARINRELDGDFKLDGFAHRAFYNAPQSRVEMHLVSRRAQSAEVAGVTVAFAAGESIHTENSYKYDVDGFLRLADAAGFDRAGLWSDARDWFSVFAIRAR